MIRQMIAAIAILTGATTSYADMLIGDLPMNGLNPTKNGTDLVTSTLIKTDPVLTSNLATGSFANVPLNTSFGPATLDLRGLSTYTFTGSLGTFTARTGQIVSQSASHLYVIITGYFNPAGILSKFEATPVEVDIDTYIRGGRTLTQVMDMHTISIPEPSSVALLVSGLICMGCVWYRKGQYN